MPRIVVLLGLILTLSGPLLRESEAASDHVRTHAVPLTPGGSLAEPDGGVGDDSGVATMEADGGHGDSTTAVVLSWDQPAAIDALPAHFLPLPVLADPGTRPRQQDQAAWLLAISHRRHAWLQLLLI
jgi:hypothetical protein